MVLAWALALVVLLESLAAVALAASATRMRLVGDRRLAVEAELALHTAIARARVTHDSALGALPPGAIVALAPPAVVGWDVVVTASREAAAALVWLHVAVGRRDCAGRPLAARDGTLLLALGGADTANVLGSRPRW